MRSRFGLDEGIIGGFLGGVFERFWEEDLFGKLVGEYFALDR